jgi:hypothetical protein
VLLRLMKIRKRVLTVSSVILTMFLSGACGAATPVPTLTATNAPSLTPITPTITPSPIPTITSLPTGTYTATPEPDTPPGCKILNEDGKLNVLSDDVFFALGPSGEELDQALADNYPEWANYKQNVSWYPEPVTVGKIVREASFQERFALNSAITLVTLGESLNWQLPSNSDLFSESLTAGERLHHLWFEWTNPENKQIRAQFSEVANAATYALYVYFGYDGAKLQAWCMTYQRLFGTSP